MSLSRRQLLKVSGLAAGAAVLPSVTANTAAAATPLRFGIGGHPYNSAAYNANSSTVPGVPYATQVSMLTAMGMGIYRTDIATNDSGLSTNHQKLLSMQGLLDAAGIDCMPMMYDNYSATLTEQENYNRGYTKAAGFASNYGHMFTHYNLGNEWELFKDLLNDGFIGNQQSHYNLPNSARAMQWIKGANAGLKSVQPTAKTSVAMAGWFPTWWQHYLLDNIDLDFVDWHWYANMQSNIEQLPGDITNILDFLWTEFGLPIWVSESNSRPSENLSQADNELAQVNWYNQWYAICLAHPHCEALLIHELLDGPMLNKAYDERNYGLVKFPNFDLQNPDHTDWAYKKLGRKLTGVDRLVGGFESTAEGWSLGLGPEFPGATGTFVRDTSARKAGSYAGVLSGDFTGGGNYVQISRAVNLNAGELRFWVRTTTAGNIALRMIDSTGQTHQQNLAVSSSGEWQELRVTTFAAGSGYHYFGGANDGVWHGPASRIGLLLNKSGLLAGRTTGAVRFDEVVVTLA